MAKVKRFWVSWYEPVNKDQDYRPISWPLPLSVPDYWCSGWTGDAEQAVLCAVVDAKNEAMARAEVRKLWKPKSFRFVEERPDGWWPAPDRFPRRASPAAAKDQERAT